jgi:geranylgeranyl diphosphate synthase type I
MGPESLTQAGHTSAQAPASLAEGGDRAARRVAALHEAELARWTLDPALAAPIRALSELVVAGGKRLRPAFCHWAFVGAGGDPDDPKVVDAAGALELLHTFALVHDDIMDGSDRRRGLPSIHRSFIDRHRAEAWRGDGRRFGEGVAILVGDFAFVYADMLMAGTPPAARPVYDELRVELCVGQYLDLAATASSDRDPDDARRIEWYKSGKYTVERPLHLGAALAGRMPELERPLTDIGLPLGEAFQSRDDILGVFGDASVTGKPVGDDLREGKLTPLVAAASARAGGAAARLLERIGAPDLSPAEIDGLRTVLEETGARAEVEATIETRVGEALTAIDRAPLNDESRRALCELATYVAWRDE